MDGSININFELKERIMHAGIEAESSDWPEPIKEEDPGREADLRARAQWFEGHARTADAMAASDEEVEDEDAVKEFLQERNADRTAESSVQEVRSDDAEETSSNSLTT